MIVYAVANGQLQGVIAYPARCDGMKATLD